MCRHHRGFDFNPSLGLPARFGGKLYDAKTALWMVAPGFHALFFIPKLRAFTIQELERANRQAAPFPPG
jgi:hypothetical protein